MYMIRSAADHMTSLTVVITHAGTHGPKHGVLNNMDDIFSDIFKYIFLKESLFVCLKFVVKGLIDNKWELVQVMAWHWSGNKPLSEPMMA